MKAAAVKAIDPERELRAARDALEIADTAANRIALADALAGAGPVERGDPALRAGGGQGAGGGRPRDPAEARHGLLRGGPVRPRRALCSNRCRRRASQSDNDRAALLLARLLEEAGETERALAIYADVGERLPGAEAQCRRAALLLVARPARPRRCRCSPRPRNGRSGMDRHERARHADMYDWAAETLAELRAEAVRRAADRSPSAPRRRGRASP